MIKEIVPPQGRILGLDYGQRRIGVAISDPLRITAQGVVTLEYRGIPKILEKLAEIVSQKEVVTIVVGLPYNLKGERGTKAKETERFIQSLRQRLNIPVIEWDERLTTVAAQRALKEMGYSTRRKKQQLDQIAAVFILQSYLDRNMHFRSGKSGQEVKLE